MFIEVFAVRSSLLLIPLGALVVWAAPVQAAPAAPYVVISTTGGTLRYQPLQGPPRVYPVGVGRRTPDGEMSPLGTWHTGPAPEDPEFYLRSRQKPAFHRGLPFIRLDLARGTYRGRSRRPFGIHGPVSSTLIWGTVSAGCIRMKPADIKEFYAFAVRNPRMAVKVIREFDRLHGRIVEPSRGAPMIPGCPESTLGVRKLRSIHSDQPMNQRICGGVDHWYAVNLKGGDVLDVRLAHAGLLRIELFGIRGISAIIRAKDAIRYKVPLAPRNRGARYLRIYAPGWAVGLKLPYTLTVSRF